MASAVNPLAGASTSASDKTASSTTDGAASKEMFLKLLVAQLQNQDPMNPMDSTQFVSEMAQFSTLEQVIAIRNDIESGVATASQSSTTPMAGTAGQVQS